MESETLLGVIISGVREEELAIFFDTPATLPSHPIACMTANGINHPFDFQALEYAAGLFVWNRKRILTGQSKHKNLHHIQIIFQ
jgi:hypothetical protein